MVTGSNSLEEKEVSNSQVRMSHLLSVEDFEGIKLSPNLSSFQIMLKVATIADQKFDFINDDHENVESNPIGDGLSRKRAQTAMKEKLLKELMKESKPVITKQHNGEQKLMTSRIKALSKIHNHNDDMKTESDEATTHEDLIIGEPAMEKKQHKGRQKAKKSMTNQFLAETRNLKRTMGDMSNEEWTEAMKKKRKQNDPNPLPPPNSLEEFKREIVKMSGETRPNQITCLIQKTLSRTDISNNHGTISIPFSQIKSFGFLRDHEMMNLKREQTITVPLIHKPRKNGLPLPLIETSLELRQLNLHEYDDVAHKDKVNPQYLLSTAWNKIVSEDELKRGDVIQIWAFRNAQDRLCMALVKLEGDEEEQQLSGSTEE